MVKAESKGRFLAPESVEEARREKLERQEERAAQRRREAVRRVWFCLALAASAGGLIYMILNGLIDTRIGVWLLAAAAAVCGRGTK